MISIEDLNAASDEEFVTLLGGIYEHSLWVARQALEQRPFRDRERLQVAMRQIVDASSQAQSLELIRAHPDLAGKLAQAGKLTEESKREQAGLGLDRLDETEYQHFSELNDRYREKFGFPFIICARATTKQGVLDAFTTRLGNSCEAEIAAALEEIHRIAGFRLRDLVG
jgi:2-oxo-4-hydroxy-4-carboxy-5-ureidoimidazoline decarboxylase